jgi:hypothetical protein
MKYWEMIAARLSKSGWSWGCVAVVNDAGLGIFVVDAHRDDSKRYVVRSDKKLTAFLQTERVTRDALIACDALPGSRIRALAQRPL